MPDYEICETLYANPTTGTSVQTVMKEGRMYALKTHNIVESDRQGYLHSFNTTYRTCYGLIKNIGGIVTIYDTWVENGKYYVLMEYLKDYFPLTAKHLIDYGIKYGDMACDCLRKDIGLKVMGILGQVYRSKVCIVDITFGNIFIHPATKQIKLVDIEPSVLIPKKYSDMPEASKNNPYLMFQLSSAFYLLSTFILEFLSNGPTNEEELWNPKS